MVKSSRNISICAIFGALQIIFLLCAKYLEIITISFYALTSLALMIPFTQKMYKEGMLTYVAVSILSVFLVGIPECLVYVTISGGFTLIFILLKEKKIKPFVSIPIEIIFANLVLLLFYSFFNSFIAIDLSKLNFGIEKIEFYHYAIITTILAILLDCFLRFAYKYLKMYADRLFK